MQKRSFSHNDSNSGINRRKLINLIEINLSISIKSAYENVLNQVGKLDYLFFLKCILMINTLNFFFI